MNNFFKTIINPFLGQISLEPNKNSFYINDKYYSYGQLFEKINAIRHLIQSHSISGELVGVVANDDIETYAAIWALWLSGKAYVPLHPNQPLDRILEIIELSKINSVLDSSKESKYSNYIKVILTSSLEPNDCGVLPYDGTIEDGKLAYLLFTSGSTGKPKGVSITRGNLAAFAESMSDTGLSINSNDRCIQPFDLTFDFSVSSYLLPLIYGACVYTVPLNKIKYLYIANLIESKRITILQVVPSMVRNLRPYFKELNYTSVRYCLFCGEALHADLAVEWSNCVPNSEIFNMYGPTEATVFCSFYIFNRETKNKSHKGVLAIGKPLKNAKMIICDGNGNELNSNEEGELCIAGAQLTPGYWADENKNKQSFFINKNFERCYRTGDICYYDDDCDFYYVERADLQVKINGFRVELGEIEFYARKILQGKNVVVVVAKNSVGVDELVIIIQDKEFDLTDIKNYLKVKLPSYMIPTQWIFVENIPVNQNGKIDRKEIIKKLNILS
jgi:amino acid adenylation domain-containing protein